jgi:hypothetical protein
VVTTAGGRILAINLTDGQVLWQTSAGGFVIKRVAANDDFTVLRLDQGQQVDLMAIDSNTGRMIGRKTFDGTVDPAPLNIALSEDGILVYTRRADICSLDLNDATLAGQGMEPKASYSGKADPNNNVPAMPIFDHMDKPDQLLIHDQSVLALSDDGKKLRIFLASTLAAMDDNPADVNSRLDADDSLHVSGKYVYVSGLRQFFSFQIGGPVVAQQQRYFPVSSVHIEKILYGRDYVVIVNRLYQEEGTRGKQVGLYGFNRVTAPTGTEDLPFVHQVDFTNIDRDATWQAFEGGIAYCSGGAVHVLMGARK